MSSWNSKRTKWPADKTTSTKPTSQKGATKGKAVAKPRKMEMTKRKEAETPAESTASFIQSSLTSREADAREELRPVGGSRKTLRKVGDYIESLLDFDPDQVVISTMGAETIKKMAVVEVNNASDDPTVTGGVNDSQMGVTDGNSCCIKCHQVHCPGHIGKITLPFPIVNRLFARDVIAILETVCNSCGRLLRSKESVETENVKMAKMKGWQYLSAYSKACRKTPCVDQECQRRRGKKGDCRADATPIDLKASKDRNVVVKTSKAIVGPEMIYSILNDISDEDARTLGFNSETHPRDLMITVLPVIPPIARPPVFAHGRIKQDQLTHKYTQIVNICNSIRAAGLVEEKVGLEENHVKLYEYISELICGSKKRRVEFDEFIDILQRIKGKKGLFRKAVQGKRVNFSARAVLSPDVDLEFGEIGVPESVARFFHMPIDVTAANYRHVVELYLAGKIVSHTPHAGENAGLKVPITSADQIQIEVGDQVERIALDGDMVVFNRQPTIHHGSLLGYTIKVTNKGSTTGLHPSSTTTHNADFDGDAAMLLYPRDPRAVKEVRELMHAIRNLIDDTQNRPMAGIIIDGISSAYLMTKEDEVVHEFIFNAVLNKMKTKVDINDLQRRAEQFGLHPYSGKTLFSALLPPDFVYNNGGIVVHSGILLSGRIKSSHIDTSHRSMVQDIWKQYGPERAADFLTDATWVLIAWLDSYGFSIGPEDIDFGATEEVANMKSKFLEDINEQIRDLGNTPETTFEKEKREEQVVSIIDRVLVFGKEIAKKKMEEGVYSVYGRQNAIGIMAKEVGSGAKSDLFNIAMMGGSVGQQFYATKRPDATLTGSGKFIPHEGDDEVTGEWGRFLPTVPIRPTDREAPVEERGYCVHSFSDGMTPTEAYSQAWGTRGDLINTNMMTAPVGEAQRRLTKALENIIIQEDGTIRAPTGPIYQFSWGGDGLESMYMLMADTALHGRIAVFCDLESIVEKANASVGLMREEYLSKIQKNVDMYDMLEEKFQIETKRGSTPSKVNNDLDQPAGEIVGSSYEKPVRSYGTPAKRVGKANIQVRTPRASVKGATPGRMVKPIAESDLSKTRKVVGLLRPSEAFESQSGQKETPFGVDREDPANVFVKPVPAEEE